METRKETRTLDGVTFEGHLAWTEDEKYGPVVSAEELRVFHGKIAQQIYARGLSGPESFRFCRKYCGLSAQKVADLFRHDIRTVQRWEKASVPPTAMMWMARMADECSKGKSTTLKRFEALLKIEAPKTINVDAA